MIKASRRETAMKNHIQEPFFPSLYYFSLRKESISTDEKSFLLLRANFESEVTVTRIYPIIC